MEVHRRVASFAVAGAAAVTPLAVRDSPARRGAGPRLAAFHNNPSGAETARRRCLVNKTVAGLVLIAAVLGTAPPLGAHHGAATFDTGTEVTLKGTVTEWLWFNPHCFLKFDVTDESGAVKNWAIETSNPADMAKRGWSRSAFKPGDTVTVTLQPARNGASVGRMRRVVRADGQVLE
jgi:hypothetical protein